jgi:gamma-glutamyl-gamma-aminobutyrate hydrolase PuuD
MSKVVAITQRVSLVSEYDEERESLDPKWYDFFSAVQNTVLVPISFKHNPEAFLERFSVDCLVLSGGNDVINTDEVYSERASDVGSDPARSLSRKRDKFERRLISLAISKNIPILGVCRGLQLLALKSKAIANHRQRWSDPFPDSL